VKSSGAARALADAAMVRLAMSHQFSDIGQLLARLESGDARPAADVKKNAVNDPSGNALPPRSAPAGVVHPVPSRSTPSAASSLRPTVSPAEMERAARDPLVQKVKAAVDGTLLDIRPARPLPPTQPPSDGESDEGGHTLLSTES
jgi:hypothetical protein